MKRAIVDISFRVSVDIEITPEDFAAAIIGSPSGGLIEIGGELRERALARASVQLAAKLRAEAVRVENLRPVTL